MAARKVITDWGKFRDQFVRETLRRASFRWPPRGLALKDARLAQVLNPKTGRICWTYSCAGCYKHLFANETKVDHIEPVVPIMQETDSSTRGGALHLGSFVHRMFPISAGFQVLCRPCHDAKTKTENEQRRANRRQTNGV